MNVLVFNCGSSSLKFSVVETESGRDLAHGLFDRLGEEAPRSRLNGAETIEESLPSGSAHNEALDRLAGYLANAAQSGLDIEAVGHRVVHGGESFRSAARIAPATIAAIEACSALAPLHNPANLLGIRKAAERFPNLPQVAVFDTAFHQSLSQEAYLYALPMQLYRAHGIRRYGFHGTSHKYASLEACRRLGMAPEKARLITVHLGNGCSAAAIQGGRCVDTTMGLTPLEGLVMGTRSGDVDPGILIHLRRSLSMSVDEIDALLNKRSGLLGLSELSNDMRALRHAAALGHAGASLAIAVFTRRLAKSIAALRATLDDLHAIVFTGGIGENDVQTRAETAAYLEFLGLRLDSEANANSGAGRNGDIATDASTVKALVIPAKEELMIARETEQILSNPTRP